LRITIQEDHRITYWSTSADPRGHDDDRRRSGKTVSTIASSTFPGTYTENVNASLRNPLKSHNPHLVRDQGVAGSNPVAPTKKGEPSGSPFFCLLRPMSRHSCHPQLPDNRAPQSVILVLDTRISLETAVREQPATSLSHAASSSVTL
jgi:hypothetical protein